MMKRIVALALTASCFVATGQEWLLPYNPDSNQDQWVGVADLQDLLTVYGNAFEAATVSENGEAAVVHLGNASYPVCLASCKNLPGRWHMATLEEFGMIWESFVTAPPNVAWDEYHVAWIDHETAQGASGGPVPLALIRQTATGPEIQVDGAPDHVDTPGLELACYCGVQQVRKIEYFTCTAGCSEGVGALDACVNEKAAMGWFPLSAQRQQQVYSTCYWQPMWRWAD